MTLTKKGGTGMAKKKKDREERVRCFGVTATQFDRRIKNKEPDQCYVCKRKEGEETICYFSNNDGYWTKKIELKLIYSIDEIDGKTFRFEYNVCFECAQLLMGQKEHQYRTVKKSNPSLRG